MSSVEKNGNDVRPLTANNGFPKRGKTLIFVRRYCLKSDVMPRNIEINIFSLIQRMYTRLFFSVKNRYLTVIFKYCCFCVFFSTKQCYPHLLIIWTEEKHLNGLKTVAFTITNMYIYINHQKNNRKHTPIFWGCLIYIH